MRTLFVVLVLAVVLSPSLATAGAKEQMHEQMLSLAQQMRAAKPSMATDPSARAAYEAAAAQYKQLSAAMGGDDPANTFAGERGRRGTHRGAREVVPTTPAFCGPATATFTQSTPTAIPTGPAVVTSTVVVSGTGPYLFDLDLTTNLTHTFSADLDITLMSPGGTIVTLTTDNGAGNDDTFNGTLWDDDANPLGQVPYTTNAGMATDHPYVNLTLASPLVPEEAMGAFIGEDPNGTWTITISDDLTGDGGSLASWSLAVTTFASAPTTVTVPPVVQSTPTAIPTGPAVVSSTLGFIGVGTSILDVNLTTNLTHTFAADLDITLLSPGGTVVTLSTDNGAGNDNVFNGTTWDDDANPLSQVPYTTNTGLVTDHPYANLTLASPLVPEEAMGAFIGEDPNGTWTITISDDLAGDGGSLDSWTLNVTTFTCAQADLSITKTDGVAAVTAGGSTTYTIVASNAGPTAAPVASVTDTFPADLTCSTTSAVAGGATGNTAGPFAGNISDLALNLPAGSSVTYTSTCTVSVNATSPLANTATVSSATPDPVPGNNSATDTDTVNPATAVITGTKTVSGSFVVDGAITYTVTINNGGVGGQADNPGDEFTDVLPLSLTLVSASATSGTAVANVGTNTVTWNGAIAASGSVTITINATIDAGTGGTTIDNQGSISFDTDGNNTNDGTVPTDDPGQGGAADPTPLTVAQQSVLEIPTLGAFGLAALIAALGLAAARAAGRQRRRS